MRPYSIGEILGIMDARLEHGDPSLLISGVTSDSRKAASGDLFCALVGDRVDGHDYVAEVFRKGARAAIIEHPVPGLTEFLNVEDPGRRFALLSVSSTVKALQALAASYRGELPTKVIGITGSVGKTSTKDLVCSVLREQFSAFGNPGNLNSHVGLPLAVLQIDGAPDYAVLEMAMRARGEIAELCAIAKPEIAVLTDISVSHIGVLGSIEEIALAKAEILNALPSGGAAIASGDNEWVRKMGASSGRDVIYYGLSEGCHVRGVDQVSLGADGSRFRVELSGPVARMAEMVTAGPMEFRVKAPGLHQVHNALAAVAIGLVTGVPYEKMRHGLENAAMSAMRLQILNHSGITIINDAYNASPKSMRSALDLLNEIGAQRKVAVLGDMLEMGSHGPDAHREVGRLAAARASYLCCSGELAKEIKAGWDATLGTGSSSWFPDKSSLSRFLGGFLVPGDTVLVKASRGMGFESVVASLTGGREVEHHD
ncbi:MAG: UDP-N-acetylmuramoyl-tripeptide--D-alanyl-D-alanine ligase [Bacillota bacterium]